MTKLAGHAISLEMVSLWAAECFLSSFVIYAIIAMPGSMHGGVASASFIDISAANSAIAFAVTISLTAMAIGLYQPQACFQLRRLAIATMVSGLAAFPALLLVGHLLRIDPDFLVGPDPLWPCKILVCWLGCLLATRLLFSLLWRSDVLTRRVVVIGTPEGIGAVREAIQGVRRGFFRIGGTIPNPNGEVTLDPAELRRRRIWGVVVDPSARLAVPAGLLDRCEAAGLRVIDALDFRERQLGRFDLDHAAEDWLTAARATRSSQLEAALRRLSDIVIATILLVATAPLMAVTALLIRVSSPGGVLYRQDRVGLNGRVFTVFKFRSMWVDAEVGRGPSWAAKGDPRVTRIGSFIRRTRIDELPQIVNILRGEMSLIGPRPERPHFVAKLAEAVPHYRDRARVKPGLTGWAQVNFPYGASVEDARMKLTYDLYYIKHRGFLLDASILLSTVRVILFQEGAR